MALTTKVKGVFTYKPGQHLCVATGWGLCRTFGGIRPERTSKIEETDLKTLKTHYTFSLPLDFIRGAEGKTIP